MFKKVYVEITNNCNLNCEFCHHTKRDNKFISKDDFNCLLGKLQGYTKYLYFHVMGEPLLHPNINELIDKASENFYINITTNGYLINRIKDKKNIRQINISLHSYNGGISLNTYLNNIFDVINILKKNTYISLRIWIKSEYTKDIIKYINEHYNDNIDYRNIVNKKMEENVFLNIHESFIWPDLDNELYSEVGTCRGLIDHIGILVDGTVVPCCLDSEGIIKLGNIYNEELNNILNKRITKDIIKGFMENKKICELCKHCNYYRKEEKNDLD